MIGEGQDLRPNTLHCQHKVSIHFCRIKGTS